MEEELGDLFADQIKRAEKRYRQHNEVREDRKEGLESGEWEKVDSKARIARRLVSLGMEDVASDVVTSDLQSGEGKTIGAEEDGGGGGASDGEDDIQINPLERILKANDLLPINFLYRGARISQAIGRIIIRNGPRPIGHGTGFMISPRLMLTNNHVLPDKDIAQNSTIEFNYYRMQNGKLSTPIEFRFQPFLFFATDKKLDFTIVALEFRNSAGVLARSRGYIPLIEKSGKSIVGEPVNIIQHPNGGPQTIAMRENKIVDVLPDHLHYETDTDQGSSGSPVFNEQWELAALHHAGVPKRNRSRRILLRDGSLWDGKPASKDLIDWVANEGVRISRIVEFMKDEVKKFSTLQKKLFDQTFEEPEIQSILDESAMTQSGPLSSMVASGTTQNPNNPHESLITIPLTIRIGVGNIPNALQAQPTPLEAADPFAQWQEEFGDLGLDPDDIPFLNED